jgi:hypothetical protein
MRTPRDELLTIDFIAKGVMRCSFARQVPDFLLLMRKLPQVAEGRTELWIIRTFFQSSPTTIYSCGAVRLLTLLL